MKRKYETLLDFPLDIYPPALQRIVADVHEERNFPVSYAAASFLVAVSTAIGSSCRVQVPMRWSTQGNIFLALVGEPGAMKSHPLSFALNPIKEVDSGTIAQFNTEIEAYLRQPLQERGARPKARQMIVQDVTLEAVAKVLTDNPHGICVHMDELSGWLQSFDRYRGSGGDKSHWLSIFDGATITVNRKTQDQIINVKNPFVNVVGTIQNDILVKSYSKTLTLDDGFFQRMLYVINSSAGERELWKEVDLPTEAEGEWNRIIASLIAYASAAQDNPKMFTFSDEAWSILCQWDKEAGDDYIIEKDSFTSGVFPKIKTYAIRFCLLLQVLSIVVGAEPDITIISESTARKACRLCDYFLSTSLEINRILNASPEEDKYGMLLERLPQKFTCQEAKDIGSTLAISRATVYRYLNDMQRSGIVTRELQGKYVKAVRL